MWKRQTTFAGSSLHLWIPRCISIYLLGLLRETKCFSILRWQNAANLIGYHLMYLCSRLLRLNITKVPLYSPTPLKMKLSSITKQNFRSGLQIMDITKCHFTPPPPPLPDYLKAWCASWFFLNNELWIMMDSMSLHKVTEGSLMLDFQEILLVKPETPQTKFGFTLRLNRKFKPKCFFTICCIEWDRMIVLICMYLVFNFRSYRKTKRIFDWCKQLSKCRAD